MGIWRAACAVKAQREASLKLVLIVKIVVINPNTTEAMTQRIAVTARAVASASTEILALTPSTGPASIEGYVDEAMAVPGMLEAMALTQHQDPSVAGYVIACFDDTGLDAARCLLSAPVVGIGEAACHLASLLAPRFSVVTTLSRSVCAIEHNIAKYGLASRCVRVRAAEVPVLDLEDTKSDAYARISAEIALALQDDRAEAIVLGCAGMTDLAAALSREHGVPVVDGVGAAVKLVESLSVLGLRTSKHTTYAPPRAKNYAGARPPFMP
jgi:allantoin racemase